MNIASKIALVAMTMTLWASVAIGAELDPASLSFGPVEMRESIEPAVRTLKNGIKVHMLEDHEVPTFQLVAYFRGGRLFEPKDKAGMSEIMAAVIRKGGTATRPGDALDEELEFLPAEVEVESTKEFVIVTVRGLVKDTDEILEIFADIIQNPAFPADKMQLEKKLLIEEIRRKNDNPRAVAFREFRKLVYGPESQWASEPTIEGVEGFERGDLEALYRRFFWPANCYVGVVGDFKSKEMQKKLKTVLGPWKRKPVDLGEPEPVKDTIVPGIYVVDRPELNQTTVVMGHLGVRRHNPDEYAIAVFNQIFASGGFTSRLMKEIRSKRGLTYGIWGSIGEDRDRGIFAVASFTKNESVGELIETVGKEIERIRTEPVEESELVTAKDAITNSWVFRNTSNAQVVKQKLSLMLRGYPADYLDTYIDHARDVDAKDVLAVADRYLHPDRMIVLAVGAKTAIIDQLEALGPVEEISLKRAE